MVLMMVTITYPRDKGTKVAKRYLDVMKKFPPDPSLGKTIVIGVKSTKKGFKVIGIGDVAKGKYEENLIRTVQSYQEYLDIDGFNYEIETFLDIAEAMPIIGLEAPEEL
ncbi:MAG: hypothetical protein ACXAC5_12220 [Promethearchaeota archaeon]|jgi:hypothetical protein